MEQLKEKGVDLNIEKFTTCFILLQKIFGNPKAILGWLQCPHPKLLNCRPIDFIVQNKIDPVISLLEKIEQDSFS